MNLADSLGAWLPFRHRLASRRRLAVAALTGIAVLCGVHAARPSAGPTVRIWVAAHTLPGGQPLTPLDVTVEALPTADVPAGAQTAGTMITGRLLAGPMERGEPVTDVRLLTPSLLAASNAPADVAVPVRVTDGAATLALVHAGNLVDIIATSDPTTDSGAASGSADSPTATTLMRNVQVLATPSSDAPSNGGGSDGAGLLIVAASRHQAAVLAAAADDARLSIAVGQGP